VDPTSSVTGTFIAGDEFLWQNVAYYELWCQYFVPINKKKQQVCNGDSALYLDWRNSYHTLVKWFFLYWGTSASGIWITLTTWSMLTITVKYFKIIIPRSRTNVQINLVITWRHPAAGQCPSPRGPQISELNTVWWEVLRHPAYSLGLLPCNFLISGPLKKALRGHTFTPDDIQEAGE